MLITNFSWFEDYFKQCDCALLQNQDSVLIAGTCQIPDPLYKLIGSIVCFYIPLGVMLLTYALTVRLLAMQQQSLLGKQGWSPGWLPATAGQSVTPGRWSHLPTESNCLSFQSSKKIFFIFCLFLLLYRTVHLFLS